MIDISIITPSYNLEMYIHTTYASILRQNVKWEWIIVDDGSTDNTVRLIKGFNDSRIRLFELAHVGNLALLRNYGARQARGRIFAFIDGDDWYTEGGLDAALSFFADKPQFDFCHTDTINFVEATNEYVELRKGNKLRGITSRRQYLTRVLRSNPISVSSFFIRREIFYSVGGFNEKFKYCEDLELWIRLLSEGINLGFIERPVIVYRIRSTSLFNSKRIKYLKTNFVVYRHFFKKHPFCFLVNLRSIIPFYSNNYFFIYKCLLESGKRARKYFWLSVLFDPRKLKYVKDI